MVPEPRFELGRPCGPRSVSVGRRVRGGPSTVGLTHRTPARDDDHGVIGVLIEAGSDLDPKNIAGINPREAADRVANYDLKKYIPRGR